ncbi:MAG: TIGR03905 family TSCPD domain-containing protein [Lachnospiraceae bacterium]|nr:TIGR03905 family TSCPD domain-containing protein [Lachnospiraceae bacterium]
MESYKTKGTCSRQIDFEIENNKVKSVRFVNGCDGNLKGISSLVEGMDIDWVIERLQNIQCGMKGTSCPDQLSKALKEYKTNQA